MTTPTDEHFVSVKATVQVAASIDTITPFIKDMLKIKLYHPFVEDVEIIGKKREGVGTVRRLTYTSGISFLETVVEDEGAEYTKFALTDHPFPCKNMFAAMALERTEEENETIFSVELIYVPNSKFSKFLMKSKIQELAEDMATNLKVLVETEQGCEKKGRNLTFEPSHSKRLDKLAKLSLVPALVCFLAFTRSIIYRFSGRAGTFVGFGNTLIKLENQCKRFGWLNNSVFEVVCDHRPLDIHALAAIAWLSIFTIQVLLIAFRRMNGMFQISHKTIGYVGFAIALTNIVGMFQLATYDFFYPMESKAGRPPAFTPFMWYVAFSTLQSTKLSWDALKVKDIDMHALWMFRAFITTFSTPMIRFYPLVLRYLLGTECIRVNADRLVIGATTVSVAVCDLLHWKANQIYLKKPFDNFMISKMKVLVLLLLVDAYFFFTKGWLIAGAIKCAIVGHENYGFPGEL